MSYGGFASPATSLSVTEDRAPAGGFFLPDGPGTPPTVFNSTTTTESKTGFFIPKVVSMQLNYRVLHRHLTGWSKNSSTFTFGNASIDTTFPHMARSKTVTTTETETTITPTNNGNTTETRILAESRVTQGSN